MQPEAFHTRIHRSFSNKVAAGDHKVVKLNLRSVPNQAVEDQYCGPSRQTPKWSIIHRVRAAIDDPSKMAKFCFVVLIEFRKLVCLCAKVQTTHTHTRPGWIWGQARCWNLHINGGFRAFSRTTVTWHSWLRQFLCGLQFCAEATPCEHGWGFLFIQVSCSNRFPGEVWKFHSLLLVSGC